MPWRDGRPSSDVLDLVAAELKIPLSTALQPAAKKQTTVMFKGVRVRREDSEQQLKLIVKPLPDRHGEFARLPHHTTDSNRETKRFEAKTISRAR